MINLFKKPKPELVKEIKTIRIQSSVYPDLKYGFNDTFKEIHKCLKTNIENN